MKRTYRTLAILFFACPSLNALAGWSCTDSAGHTYTVSQRVLTDACTDMTTDEERAASQHPEPKPKPFKSKPAEARQAMAAGKKAVLDELKDPESARFRNLITARDVFLCGEVNAKNAMGGYVGFKRFVALGEVGLIDFDDGSQKFINTWLESCEGYMRHEIDKARARFLPN
ncbi:hypothetical protein LP416_27900 [Polaromonas sp. P2-4]|nr:hypothetical protein LP416_27900 [Polaromonas sp. P2-4]